MANGNEDTIIKYFEKCVATHPAALALSYKSETLNYTDLNAKSNQLANYLIELGCHSNSIVAVCIDRSADLIISILAVLKAGATFLPLDETSSLDHLQSILKCSKASILISKPYLQDKLDFFTGKSIYLEPASVVHAKSSDNCQVITKSHHNACAFYDVEAAHSLGVLLEHANIVNYARWFDELMPMRTNTRIEFSTSMSSSKSITSTLIPLMLGWHVIICPNEVKSDLNNYLIFLNQHQINIVDLTTEYFTSLLEIVSIEKTPLLNLKNIILQDTKLLTGICVNWLNLYPQQNIFNMYGTPETTVAATVFKVTLENVVWLQEYIPIGKPGPDILYRLTSSGELEIGGACVAKGYLHREHQTQQKFFEEKQIRWFKTGLICKLSADKELIFIKSDDAHAIGNTNSISQAPITHPLNQLDNQILAVWAKEFALEKVSMNDNFFELGGHSLIATRILSKLEKITGKRIYIQDIYVGATPAELSQVINNAEDLSATETNAYDETHGIPLSDFQFMFWIADLYEKQAKKLNVLTRKRFDGAIDHKVLDLAFNKLLQKQHLLSFRFSKYKPMQMMHDISKSPLVVKDITMLTDQEQERVLNQSMDELSKYYQWNNDKPSLVARLFYLSHEATELQLCMPHIVADDYSLELLYNDLSMFYNDYNNNEISKEQRPLAQFNDYVQYERSHFNRNLERDKQYWENNFKDTILFPFPKEQIIPNIEAIGSTFSTYMPITDDIFDNLKKKCFQNKVNVLHVLSAAVALVLYNHLSDDKYREKNFYFNVVKSMRDDEIFDDVVGCMLRSDAFKLQINPNLNIIDTAHKVQTAMIENAPYQNCSGMVKLASVDSDIWKKHKVLASILKLAATLYSKLFPRLKLNPIILNSYARLGFFRKDEMFLLNINLWGNFVSGQNKSLFGNEQIDLPFYQFDLTTINNVLDITFLRDDFNKNHLVLSGNLHPDFRAKLASEVIAQLANI